MSFFVHAALNGSVLDSHLVLYDAMSSSSVLSIPYGQIHLSHRAPQFGCENHDSKVGCDDKQGRRKETKEGGVKKNSALDLLSSVVDEMKNQKSGNEKGRSERKIGMKKDNVESGDEQKVEDNVGNENMELKNNAIVSTSIVPNDFKARSGTNRVGAINIELDLPGEDATKRLKYSLTLESVKIASLRANERDIEFNDARNSVLTLTKKEKNLVESLFSKDYDYDEVLSSDFELDEIMLSPDCVELDDDFFDVAMGRINPDLCDLKIQNDLGHPFRGPNCNLFEKENSERLIRPVQSIQSAAKILTRRTEKSEEIRAEKIEGKKNEEPDDAEEESEHMKPVARNGRVRTVTADERIARAPKIKKKRVFIDNDDDTLVDSEPTRPMTKPRKNAKAVPAAKQQTKAKIAPAVLPPEKGVQTAARQNITSVDMYKLHGIEVPQSLSILATEAPIGVLLERGFPSAMLQRLTSTAPGQSGSSIPPSLIVPEVYNIFGKEYKYKLQDPLFDQKEIPPTVLMPQLKAAVISDVCVACLQELKGRDTYQMCTGPCLRSWHVTCMPTLADYVYANAAWKCPDCITSIYSCFVCKVVSRNGEQIYPCSEGCGSFFHPGCMELWFQSQVPLETWRNRSYSCHLFFAPHVKKNLIQLPSVSLDPRNGSYGPCPRHFCHGCGYRLPAVEIYACIACPQVFPRHQVCNLKKQSGFIQLSKQAFVCPLHPELQSILRKMPNGGARAFPLPTPLSSAQAVNAQFGNTGVGHGSQVLAIPSEAKMNAHLPNPNMQGARSGNIQANQVPNNLIQYLAHQRELAARAQLAAQQFACGAANKLSMSLSTAQNQSQHEFLRHAQQEQQNQVKIQQQLLSQQQMQFQQARLQQIHAMQQQQASSLLMNQTQLNISQHVANANLTFPVESSSPVLADNLSIQVSASPPVSAFVESSQVSVSSPVDPTVSSSFVIAANPSSPLSATHPNASESGANPSK